jgi:hypothetical protein
VGDDGRNYNDTGEFVFSGTLLYMASQTIMEMNSFQRQDWREGLWDVPAEAEENPCYTEEGPQKGIFGPVKSIPVDWVTPLRIQ